MTGREKVVSGLRHCLFDHAALDILDVTNHCNGCPYYTSPECECDLYYDALELLKTQEPVEPLLALNDGEHKLWQCGNCKVAVFTRDSKYCHNCGKAVKWDAV